MKKYMTIAVLLFSHMAGISQSKTTTEPPVACADDADVDRLPGKYYDHTQPKYPSSLKASTSQDKAAMLNQLIALEKVEEKSRNNFTLTGCVLRTSFSSLTTVLFNRYLHIPYEYQLAAYQNVCHVQEHVVKTVGEYRTVIRVAVNPGIAQGRFFGVTGDFYISDKSVRYEIPVDGTVAQRNAGYPITYSGRRISQFITMKQVATSKEDFQKINNGNGYVEEVMQGSDPRKYQWLNRHWYITKPGIPLFIPVTRKEYLEALLEYYELENENFSTMVARKMQEDAKSSSPEAQKRMHIYEIDKAAYPGIYKAKKEKVSQLLTTQKAAWLASQAIVANSWDLRPNDYAKPSNGLLDFEKFYDNDNQNSALYQYNPEYFKSNTQQPTKPVFMSIQFRYEMGRGFSERLFNNFVKNFDMDALKKMLQ